MILSAIRHILLITLLMDSISWNAVLATWRRYGQKVCTSRCHEYEYKT